MNALPLGTRVWLAAGVTVTLRLVPLPGNVMLLVGARVALEEVARKTRLFAGVSTSATCNGTVAGTSSATL